MELVIAVLSIRVEAHIYERLKERASLCEVIPERKDIYLNTFVAKRTFKVVKIHEQSQSFVYILVNMPFDLHGTLLSVWIL
jgi:hypothetical protein